MDERFGIDDIVVIRRYPYDFLHVSGVVHDAEHLFVRDPTNDLCDGREFRVDFDEVMTHWKKM